MAKAPADWRRALLARLNYKPTKQNLSFLESWQRWEGGHTNNSATFNWLNTTRKDMPGQTGQINSVGVKSYDTFQHGIGAIAATLKGGRYKDILQALSSGDPYANAPAAGLQVWVSGSPNGNPGYVAKVLGRRVASKTAPPTPVSFKAPPPPQAEDNSWEYAMSLIFDHDQKMYSIFASLDPNKRDAAVQKQGIVDPGGSLQPVPLAPGKLGSLVSAAQSQLGKPYVFGSGPSTESFDCSDLIQWAYGQIGVKISRTTFTQIKEGRSVKGKPLQIGDLFFSGPGHVMLYVGHGKLISAPQTGQVVQYKNVSDYGAPYEVRRVVG